MNDLYESGRVGHDPLERFMKYMIKDAKLSNPGYSNHSIRATVITSLNESGYEARHIIAITGHKSETTVKQYAKKCPEKKKREMSECLAVKLDTKKAKLEGKVDKIVNMPFRVHSKTAATMVTPLTNNSQDNMTSALGNQNLQLLLFDDTDDDLLLKVLDKFDKENPLTNTQLVQNIISSCQTQAMLPQMYFPNSTVTINYNFAPK